MLHVYCLEKLKYNTTTEKCLSVLYSVPLPAPQKSPFHGSSQTLLLFPLPKEKEKDNYSPDFEYYWLVLPALELYSFVLEFMICGKELSLALSNSVSR